MFKKEYISLVISAFVLLIVLIMSLASENSFYQVTILGIQMSIIWIPIAIAILFLPLFNITTIIKNVDSYSIPNWIALALNIATILIVLKSFNISLFEDYNFLFD